MNEALTSASDTRLMEMGRSVLERVPVLFRSGFKDKKAVVVCDQTTFRVAGERVFKYLEMNECTQMAPFIFEEPKPYAGFDNVIKLERFLKTHDAIPVVVGSGTLNDLTKLASARAGRQYMCVATAASMDGYTAYGASITSDGSKQTFSCPAPLAVLADVEVIRHAPSFLTASGYADLAAKVTAGADWILADALKVEPIDRQAWSIVQDGLMQALADPEGARRGKPEAVTPLAEGLIMSGFAMQWLSSSRPASGAEHQFSHLWNMEHHTYHGEAPSHGFQVGVATLAVTRLYEKMLETHIDLLDVEAAVSQWEEWPQYEHRIIGMFGDTGFLNTALTETKKKHPGKEVLREQLLTLKEAWPQLKERLAKQLIPSYDMEKRLLAAGAPVKPEQIGLSQERMKASFLRALHIRSRFTVLDIAARTGCLNRWLNELYR